MFTLHRSRLMPFEGGEVGDEEVGVNKPLLGGGGAKQPLFAKAVQLGFVSGVIARAQLEGFERVLWRSTRGNLFMKVRTLVTVRFVRCLTCACE